MNRKHLNIFGLASLTLILSLTFLSCDSQIGNPTNQTPIAISSPSQNATLADPVEIQVTIGQGYSFVKIDFLIDTVIAVTDSVAPFSYYWDVLQYTSGTDHSIQAIGHDALDSVFASAIINISVEYISQQFTSLASYNSNVSGASGLAYYDGMLFVANGTEGLFSLDVTDKTAPSFLANFDSPGNAAKADAAFPFVFIADKSQGVTRLNFSDPDTFIVRGQFTTQSLANDIAISGSYAYVVENDGFTVLNISSPTNLVFESRQSIGQDLLNYVIARNDTAFLVGNNSFYVVDCSNPSQTEILGQYNGLSNAMAVAVDDTLAFIADGAAGVLVLSIDDPTSPVFMARYNTQEILNTIDVYENIVFIGNNAGGIIALEYGSDNSFTVLDSFDIGNNITEVQYHRPYLYVSSFGSIEILRFIN